MKLAKAIKKYPDGVIYYFDNNAWTFYSKLVDPLEDEDYEKYEVDIDEWHDFDEGYAPAVVVALAKILKIRVESV